jgi:hypothetical protein
MEIPAFRDLILKPQPDYVRRCHLINGNAIRVRNNRILKGPHMAQLTAEGFAAPAIGEILGEMPLNSDIVVMFYMGVGGFLHLPGCWEC